MTFIAKLVVTSVLLSFATACASECLGGKQGALMEGGFTGPLVCSNENSTFSYVGRTTGRIKYSIYDYRYRYLPSHGAVMHGGQRILVFDGDTYIGQYVLSPPPYVTTALRGDHLTLEAGDAEKVTADFSNGPPKDIYLDGETEDFHR
jgi:hypothetical protein